MKYLIAFLFCFTLFSLWSQEKYKSPSTWSNKQEKKDNQEDSDAMGRDTYKPEAPSFLIGAGVGMDFGGIGGKLEYMFYDYLGAFIGVGYNFHDTGLNGGVVYKPFANEKAYPYLFAMYGYNGVVVIQNAEHMNRVSYGLSLGAGIEIKTKNFNAWQIGLLLPFRSKKFIDYYEELKENPSIVLGDLPRFGFSLGFKIMI